MKSAFPVRKSLLFAVLAMVVVQIACAVGAKTPSTSPQQPEGSTLPSDQTPSDAGASSAGQITITGTINKIYTPVRISAGPFGGQIRLYIHEDNAPDLSRMGDTLTLDFDASLQPGTYPFENFLDNYSTSMYVFYDVPSDPPVTYKSIAGTLTLTAVGSTISGSFQVTAADSVNPENTIVITGSFSDLPVSP